MDLLKKTNKLQTQDISQINLIYFYENVDYPHNLTKVNTIFK